MFYTLGAVAEFTSEKNDEYTRYGFGISVYGIRKVADSKLADGHELSVSERET